MCSCSCKKSSALLYSVEVQGKPPLFDCIDVTSEPFEKLCFLSTSFKFRLGTDYEVDTLSLGCETVSLIKS